MTDLKKICGSMYRALDEGAYIKQCISNPKNNSLSDDVLEQIDSKCGNIMPLQDARACAQELGLSLAEPKKAQGSAKEDNFKGPSVTWVESRPAEDCSKKFNEHYIKTGEMDSEGYTRCLMGTDLFNDVKAHEEAKRKEAEIKEKQEERAKLNVWGKFAFKIGVDVVDRSSEFAGAFDMWNAGNPANTHSSTGVIDKGWRAGLRVALTTSPGLTRWPRTNILFKGTIFDVTVYDDKKLLINKEEELEFDALDWQFLKFEFHIPFFQRNFFELKFNWWANDLIWWKSDKAANIGIGMNYQFQGTPLTTSERTLDVSEMAYILSSYTMFGILFGIRSNDAYQNQKVTEFCGQLGINADTCYKYYEDIGFDYYSDDGKTELTLTPQLFGEQRWSGGAITYEAALDWFPLFKKLQPRADISASIFLGPAMELFLEASARALISIDKDNDVLLPEKGYEFRFFSGLSFRPSQIF